MGLQFDARECHYLGILGEGSTGHSDYVFAVSDGLGGANAGQFASRIAVEKVTTLLPPCYLQTAAGLDAGFPDVLQELFAEIHEALVYLGASDAECDRMTEQIMHAVNEAGEVFLSHTKLNDRFTLRMSIGNIRTERKHVALASSIKPLATGTKTGWCCRMASILRPSDAMKVSGHECAGSSVSTS